MYGTSLKAPFDYEGKIHWWEVVFSPFAICLYILIAVGVSYLL